MNVFTLCRLPCLGIFLTVAMLAAVTSAYGCEIELTSSPQATAKPASNIGCGGGGGGNVPYSDSYSWGTATGAANTNTLILNGINSSEGTSIAVSYDNNDQTLTATLTHSIIQLTYINNNGSREMKYYIYTKSAYAPESDNGTFVYDSSGNLIEGAPTDLSRLASEVREADPNQVAVAEGIWGTLGDWFGNHTSQILACGVVAGAVAINVVAVVTMNPDAIAAAGEWDYVEGPEIVQIASTDCF